jgi:putative FmdB family regulatory protein
MPIYEYRCRECQDRFERLVRGGDKVVCPRCGCARLDRLFSVFGVKSSGKFIPSSSSCGSCSATSCEGCSID